ncbi:MAG: PepSY-associated TM helix domain-containing protein, partial [Bacteroidota bacterium]
VVAKVHFAQFGGYFVRIVYFILALITCFVIISGVMIWIEARSKKTYAHKAKFNRNVGAIYLGACLGLYPAIALFFCIAKLYPAGMENSFGLMASIFFGFWLAYIIYALVIKNYFKINKHALFLAGSMGLLIPVLNGFQSGVWFWQALARGYPDLYIVDLGWLLMGIISLTAARYAKPAVKEKRVVQKEAAKGQEVASKVIEPLEAPVPVLSLGGKFLRSIRIFLSSFLG